MNRNAFKTCKACGKLKTLAEFYPHPECKDGFRNSCKECSREKWGKPGKCKEFLPEAISKMTRLHKSIRIEYFGYFVGILIYLRKNEILAFSVLKGSEIFKNRKKAKAWLCIQVIIAGSKIRNGLFR